VGVAVWGVGKGASAVGVAVGAGEGGNAFDCGLQAAAPTSISNTPKPIMHLSMIYIIHDHAIT
jgi:hypothetical protein